MSDQQFSQQERIALIFLSILGVAAYFWNLGFNNIWTPNEAFYAEAVREMYESGNFVDIFYNYEPRFNKPPLLYWMIAFCGKIFGLTEFAIRLPSTLCGLGTAWLVYKIGELLEGKRFGAVAALVMLFSFQFTINARYAAPAVPLTYFFTLTVYWFLKGYKNRNFRYILLAYVALGLTILTKGYPYLIVIGAIIVVYIFFDTRYQWRSFFKQLGFLRLYIGVPLALLIGMSWIMYMYATWGDEFYQIFMDETYRRALTKKSSPKPFFYLEANTWGFLPYSLTFYFALIYLLATRFRHFLQSDVLKVGFSWFLVMLVIFTVAKGKIPTYFIQGHPGMSLMTAWLMMNYRPETAGLVKLRQFTYWLPAVLLFIGCFVIIYIFNASPLYYLLAVLPAIVVFMGYKKDISFLKIPYAPYISFAILYLLVSMIVMPFVEKDHRLQPQIGAAIKEHVPADIPVIAENFKLHNLPFYAERQMLEYMSESDIRAYAAEGKPLLVLLPAEHKERYGEAEVLWEGPIYTSSETRTMQLILDVLKDKRGEENRFAPFALIYKK